MAIILGQGLSFTGADESDDRSVYPTVEAALTTGGLVNGIQKPRISPGRRFIGMKVYIAEEDREYRFTGGTSNAHFLPVPAGDGGESMSAGDLASLQGLVNKLMTEGYLSV